MSVSRKTIREDIITRLPGAYVGTADTASTATRLYDQNDELFMFSAAGSQNYEGSWLIRPDASDSTDRVRRIAKHDTDEGWVAVSRAWTNAPDGETYEVLPPSITPTEIDACINKGLKRLTYLTEESVTPVSKDNSYTLAYSWLENERQVLEVYREYTNSPTIHREEWSWWKVFRDGTTFTLRINPLPSTASGEAIIVEGKAYYTALATDAATTDCPQSWAVAAGYLETVKLMRRKNAGQDVSRWAAEIREASKELLAQSKRYAPRRGRRMMQRTAPNGTGYGPRRGEFYY